VSFCGFGVFLVIIVQHQGQGVAHFFAATCVCLAGMRALL